MFKVVLVGNAGVGKTCLVRRFTQGMFPPGQGATIGVDFMIKTVEIEGEKIKVSHRKNILRLGLQFKDGRTLVSVPRECVNADNYRCSQVRTSQNSSFYRYP